jgi:hypothetical protein
MRDMKAGAIVVAKRKLSPVERIVVKVDRELEEKAQHPDKVPVVRVADEVFGVLSLVRTAPFSAAP